MRQKCNFLGKMHNYSEAQWTEHDGFGQVATSEPRYFTTTDGWFRKYTVSMT